MHTLSVFVAYPIMSVVLILSLVKLIFSGGRLKDTVWKLKERS